VTEEKLIPKSPSKKRSEGRSSEKMTFSAGSGSRQKISHQPPGADEKFHEIREILRKLSVGKYYTKMYFNGKDS
jgi:hypothetical protein